MSENKWQEFQSPEWRLQDLGRPAVFIIPLKALWVRTGEGSIEDELNRFLFANFTAFTSMSIPSFGVWSGPGQTPVFDESRMYEVSFKGKERIPLLVTELARIARLTGEECIYLKAGQYACLIHPS
jgi:hypothetical protein